MLPVTPTASAGVLIMPTVFTDDAVVNGNCTLREAVIAANTNAAVDECPAGSGAGVDEIVLQPGTYSLTVAGAGEDMPRPGTSTSGGRPHPRGDLRIDDLEDQASLSNDRIFDVHSVGLELALVWLVAGVELSGGGIFNREP